jgi:hypothetical protein
VTPFSRAGELIGFDDASRGSEKECKGGVGSCVIHDTRCIADDDSTFSAGDDVDVVVASGNIADDPQAGPAVEQLAIES